MVNWREVAKFLAGFEAGEAVAHIMIGLLGVLPINVFGLYTLTQDLNTIRIPIHAIIAFALAYYGWIKK